MPKSTKKKKDKAADFTKAKLKLGKGKQAPTNAVDTSFKARSIALPSQNIAIDKECDAPTTKRRLTFDALVAHMKHYNANTRKDAIHGLRELLEAHPELIPMHLTTLVNTCVRLIGDEDANVRKVLLSFFTWLFRQVSNEDLIPHSSVLILFTTSAQTHIFPEIRIDAIRFLDVYLEYIPDIISEGWTHAEVGRHGRRVLEGYLGILNAGTTFGEGGVQYTDSSSAQATSTASVVLSASSKLVVLKSLASFFGHAIASAWNPSEMMQSSATISTPTWYFSSSFATTSAFASFDSLLPTHTLPQGRSSTTLPPSTKYWKEEVSEEGEEDFVGQYPLISAPSVSPWSLKDLSDVGDFVSTTPDEDKAGAKINSEVTCVIQLARTLHSTLVSTFLDCAPTVFSPSSNPSETELQLVLVVCRICRNLYGRILQDSAESGTLHESAAADLQTILSHLSPYFPFTVAGSSTAKRDIKSEQAFQDLNLIFCELSSFLVLTSQRTGTRSTPPRERVPHRGRTVRTGASHSTVPPPLQIERVGAYIQQLLQGQSPSGGQSLSRSITPQAYVALLPTIWSLINTHSPDASDASSSTFAALVAHAMKTSSTSAVKRHTIDFVARLILLDREPEYHGVFRIGKSEDWDTKLEEWILQLPKTLWELGNNHPMTAETIIRFLLRSSQRRSKLLTSRTYAALSSRLVPYFVMTHPARGQLPGPYSKLPVDSPLRPLILDLVATLTTYAPHPDGDLGRIVSQALRDSPDASYWAGVYSSS